MPGARSQPGSVSCSALDLDCDTGPGSCESSSSRRAGPGPGSRVLFSLSGPDCKIDLDCETGRGGARKRDGSGRRGGALACKESAGPS